MKNLMLVLALGMCFGLVACGEGEKKPATDGNTPVDAAGDAAKKAGDAAGDAAKKAGDAAKDAADKAGN